VLSKFSAGILAFLQQIEDFYDEIGRFSIFVFKVLARLGCIFHRKRLLLQQMESIGVYSIPIAFLTCTFTGMVLVLQTGRQLAPFGAKIYSGGISTVALASEIGPVLTAIVLAGRVGAGMTAEIGTMKVSEQIDALKSLATNPIDYLVVPRLVAAVIMLPVITVGAIFVGYMGGVVVAASALDLAPRLYIISSMDNWLRLSDFFIGVGKTAVFGTIIALVGCYNGFATSWGAEGVGKATTKSVVTSSILILIVNYFISDWFLKLFPI
jgi:phospholipid/cholesterol/gamma-HCH transport system permease protein